MTKKKNVIPATLHHSRESGNPSILTPMFVYLLATKPNGTLYVGVTNDLVRRIYEHKEGLAEGFTKKYGVKMLVYFERHETPQAAITREKQIKKWKRAWKADLIERTNPQWRDLYPEICT